MIDQTAFIGSTFLSPPQKSYVTSGGVRANATNERFELIVVVRVKAFSRARLRMIRSSGRPVAPFVTRENLFDDKGRVNTGE